MVKFNQITNNLHLQYILDRLYTNYLNKVSFDIHVTPIDKLSNIKTKDKQIIIINFQKSTQPGNHWVLLLNYIDKYVVYFDSFGLPPPALIHDHMKKYNKEMIYTTKQIQKLENDQYCGWACLKFLYFVINKNEPVYEAVNNMNKTNILSYGKSLTKKYLKYFI